MKRLVIDYEKCVGCELCAMRCSLEKTGSMVNPSQARIHLVRVEEEGIMMPAVCRHCDEPKCIPACPVRNCMTKDSKTGLVSINAELCIGCKKCTEACPYGGPVGIPRENPKPKQSSTIKVLCDLCHGNPVCVEFCPTACLQYTEADPALAEREKKGKEELAALIAQRK
ncbi:MAG: 4Fe-4S dicluster domain-containing protein [Chloroflexota bacterium]